MVVVKERELADVLADDGLRFLRAHPLEFAVDEDFSLETLGNVIGRDLADRFAG